MRLAYVHKRAQSNSFFVFGTDQVPQFFHFAQINLYSIKKRPVLRGGAPLDFFLLLLLQFFSRRLSLFVVVFNKASAQISILLCTLLLKAFHSYVEQKAFVPEPGCVSLGVNRDICFCFRYGISG